MKNEVATLTVPVDDELHLQTENGQVVVSSRYIADRFGKRHSDVLESISNLKAQMSTTEFSALFIPSSYKASNGKINPEYLLTRDGFTLLAMGFTGQEALKWKLKYIEAFNKMETALKQQQKPMCLEDILIAQLQDMKAVKDQLNQVNHHALEAKAESQAVKEEVQAMRDVITLDHKVWRDEIRKIVVSIAQKFGGNQYIQDVWKEAYSLLEQRGRTKLEIRLNNRRKNILAETGSNNKANKYTKLDVIDEEAKLRETFIAIVKEMAIKYGVA